LIARQYVNGSMRGYPGEGDFAFFKKPKRCYNLPRDTFTIWQYKEASP
jgi:hypothetical protein